VTTSPVIIQVPASVCEILKTFICLDIMRGAGRCKSGSAPWRRRVVARSVQMKLLRRMPPADASLFNRVFWKPGKTRFLI
jgi:hypothetical protein